MVFRRNDKWLIWPAFRGRNEWPVSRRGNLCWRYYRGGGISGKWCFRSGRKIRSRRRYHAPRFIATARMIPIKYIRISWTWSGIYGRRIWLIRWRSDMVGSWEDSGVFIRDTVSDESDIMMGVETSVPVYVNNNPVEKSVGDETTT